DCLWVLACVLPCVVPVVCFLWRVCCGVRLSLNLLPVRYCAFVDAPSGFVGGGCVDCVGECECPVVGVSVAYCVFDHSPAPSFSTLVASASTLSANLLSSTT